MKKILHYFLNFRPGGNGRIIFRLEGENQDRMVDLNPADFTAIAVVLAQRRLSFHVQSGTFISYDDDNNSTAESGFAG